MKSFDEFYESLWANIHKKRQRIKQGSGERMRKKGEKGAPTPAQMARAKGEGVQEDGHTEKDKVDKAQKRELDTIRRKHDAQDDNAIKRDAINKGRATRVENAPSLALLKKKIKSGTKLGSTETASAKARGLIPRADGTKRKSPKYK